MIFRPEYAVKHYKGITKTHRYLQCSQELGTLSSCARTRKDAVSRCQLTVSRDMLTTGTGP
jgi:hypothetical protein